MYGKVLTHYSANSILYPLHFIPFSGNFPQQLYYINFLKKWAKKKTLQIANDTAGFQAHLY